MNGELITLKKDYAKKDNELEVMIILTYKPLLEYVGIT